jgi:hypothetical protein
VKRPGLTGALIPQGSGIPARALSAAAGLFEHVFPQLGRHQYVFHNMFIGFGQMETLVQQMMTRHAKQIAFDARMRISPRTTKPI